MDKNHLPKPQTGNYLQNINIFKLSFTRVCETHISSLQNIFSGKEKKTS